MAKHNGLLFVCFTLLLLVHPLLVAGGTKEAGEKDGTVKTAEKDKEKEQGKETAVAIAGENKDGDGKKEEGPNGEKEKEKKKDHGHEGNGEKKNGSEEAEEEEKVKDEEENEKPKDGAKSGENSAGKHKKEEGKSGEKKKKTGEEEGKEEEGKGGEGKGEEWKEEEGKGGEGKEESGTKGEGGEGESLEEIVKEDRKVAMAHYEKIRPRLEEAKKKAEAATASHHPRAAAKKHPGKDEAEKKLTPIQEVANAVANTKMHCPQPYNKFFEPNQHEQQGGPKDAEKEREEMEWAQRCDVLEEMRDGLVDWLEFIDEHDGQESASKLAKGGVDAKHSEKEEEEEGKNKANYPEKMSVRPMLEVMRPMEEKAKGGGGDEGAPPHWPPPMEEDLVDFGQILEFYEEIAEGKKPADVKGQLKWYNIAEYKFVRKTKKSLEKAVQRRNPEEEMKNEKVLEEIWKDEQAVLAGQSAEFKNKADHEEYKKHVDKHRNRFIQKMGRNWTYGQSHPIPHAGDKKKGVGHVGKQEGGGDVMEKEDKHKAGQHGQQDEKKEGEKKGGGHEPQHDHHEKTKHHP